MTLASNPFCNRIRVGVIGTLPGTADDADPAIAWELVETRPQLAQRDVERVRHVIYGELHVLAHVEKEPIPRGVPVRDGMPPRSTPAATIPAKLIGSFALPNGGARCYAGAPMSGLGAPRVRCSGVGMLSIAGRRSRECDSYQWA